MECTSGPECCREIERERGVWHAIYAHITLRKITVLRVIAGSGKYLYSMYEYLYSICVIRTFFWSFCAKYSPRDCWYIQLLGKICAPKLQPLIHCTVSGLYWLEGSSRGDDWNLWDVRALQKNGDGTGRLGATVQWKAEDRMKASRFASRRITPVCSRVEIVEEALSPMKWNERHSILK